MEAPNQIPSRRSLHAARHLRPGQIVRSADIVALRPGNGLPLDAEAHLIGTRLTRGLAAGQPFEACDLALEEWRRDVA